MLLCEGERGIFENQEEIGGGPGIRTPGRLLTYGGFQDRCIQPLCQPTAPCCPIDSGVHHTEKIMRVNDLKITAQIHAVR